MTALIKFLHDIAQTVRCAILIIHHSTKDAKGASLYAPRGASALVASVRSIWVIADVDGKIKTNVDGAPRKIALSCVKSNHFQITAAPIQLRQDTVVLPNGDDVIAMDVDEPA